MRRNSLMRVILQLVLMLACLPIGADTIHTGKVINIADGGTLTVLVDKQQFRIRLSDIDTRERNSPSAQRRNAVTGDLGR